MCAEIVGFAVVFSAVVNTDVCGVAEVAEYVGFVAYVVVMLATEVTSSIEMLIVAFAAVVVDSPLVVSLKTVGVLLAVDRVGVVSGSATVLFAGGDSVVEGMGKATLVDFSEVATADFVDISDVGIVADPAEIVLLSANKIMS